ncbi:unnamed protein product, partial [Haemonchus placei]|uniref:WAP domain-containing protein n=1 Tax=Haemonchus placei TaxID=6290 RepID=A0A0N4WC87_HAEPC
LYYIILYYIILYYIIHITLLYSDYCPSGWSVQRKASYDAMTCDPMAGIKCEKPYQCVHSQCGMSFCCVNTKHLKQWIDQKEAEADMHDDSQEEL